MRIKKDPFLIWPQQGTRFTAADAPSVVRAPVNGGLQGVLSFSKFSSWFYHRRGGLGLRVCETVVQVLG